MDDDRSAIMKALESFEGAEANLTKLEGLWAELRERTPQSVVFGGDAEYEDRLRSYRLLLNAIPKIDGWKPTAEPRDLNEIAQSRFDAMEAGEPLAQVYAEEWVEEPGVELKEYRFRLNNARRALIRGELVGLIDQIDADIRSLRDLAGGGEKHIRLDNDAWADLRSHIAQVEVLLGSSVKKPDRWSDMLRHMNFGQVGDLDDIERFDWPAIKSGLRKGLYGANEPIPVQVDDLSAIVAAKPGGVIATRLDWANIDDEEFERLVFGLISDAPGYENPEWLMKTRAPDRGRDLSVYRVSHDTLAGTSRQRVVIQCKHLRARSLSVADVSVPVAQMRLWSAPRVAVLVIATSGRFSADAVAWIEEYNVKGDVLRIEMWPESHLERLLAARPGFIAEFGLRD